MFTKIRVKEILGKCYCEDCENWFDIPIVEEVDEPRGEYWGIPCTEHMVYRYCPVCGSEAIIDAKDMIEDDEELDEHPDDFDPWTNYDRRREI